MNCLNLVKDRETRLNMASYCCCEAGSRESGFKKDIHASIIPSTRMLRGCRRSEERFSNGAVVDNTQKLSRSGVEMIKFYDVAFSVCGLAMTVL